MVQDSRAEDDIDLSDSLDGFDMGTIAKDKFNCRTTGFFFLFKFRCRAKNIDGFNRIRACLLSDESVLTINTPHATNVSETMTRRILTDVLGQTIVVTDVIAEVGSPVTPEQTNVAFL